MSHVTIPDADGLLSIRITRAPDRRPGESGGLPLTHWLRVVESDPSLLLIEYVSGIDPQSHEPMRIPCPNAARWLAHPDQVPFVFYFRAGEVVLHSGDRHTAIKAQALAALLQAHVVIGVD